MSTNGTVQVLLCEPDTALQKLLGDSLAGAGYSVRSVKSAEEALAAIGEGDVPLTVTEVALPGADGLELARKLRAKDPTAAVVLLSESDDPRLSVSALRVGVVDYLVKPWDGLETLLQGVDRARTRREQSRQRRDFLHDISELNEAFLRQLVKAEKENVDLQDQLSGSDSGPAAAEESGPYPVLIVDDEAVILTVLSSLLGEEGYEVHTTFTAEDALEKLQARRFDMIITDKNLPGMSGLELIRKIRDSHPDIETVMITGYGSLESAIEALHLGAGGYLLKPFEDIGIVLGKVNELRARQLERRRAKRYLQSFKARNQSFLDQYKEIRAKLQQFLGT
jgi:DNA-binding NtrC family response regulator